MVDGFDGVHAAIGFGEESFCVEAIFGVEGRAHAEREEVSAADLAACFLGEVAEEEGSFFDGIGGDVGGYDDELVASHAGGVIVGAADLAHGVCEEFEDLVAGEVAVAVVDFLEAVEIADDDGHADVFAFAAREFLLEVHGKGTGVGHAGEVIDGGGVFGFAVLEGVFDKEGDACGDDLEDAEVFGGEGVGFSLVEGENTDEAGDTFEGDGEG